MTGATLAGLTSLIPTAAHLSSINATNHRHPSAGWDPDSRTAIYLIERQFSVRLRSTSLGPDLRRDNEKSSNLSPPP